MSERVDPRRLLEWCSIPAEALPGHPGLRVPAWASMLALSGTYEQLFTYVTCTALIFNVAGGLAIFRLRRLRR